MGAGCREGQQSLAMVDTKNMNKIDFLIINISRFLRMLKVLNEISNYRYNKKRTLFIFITTFFSDYIIRTLKYIGNK